MIILEKRFFVKDFLRLSVINLAVPSAVLSAIFPVKPSVTITFEKPSIILFPSIYPLNIKLFSLLRLVNFLKVFFNISVPLISSDPILRSDTNGFLFGKKEIYISADPISAKSTRLFSSHSIFAPRSKTTFIFFYLAIDLLKQVYQLHPSFLISFLK